MKKTLLLAAALACSGVAQADTWTCTSTAGASLMRSGYIVEGIIGRTWVADTRRGMRFPSPEKAGSEYLGKCEVTAEFNGKKSVYCNAYYVNIGVQMSLFINELRTGEIIFSASNLGISGGIHAGTCIKI